MYDSHLIKWSYFENDKVKLLYDDGSKLLVLRSDFDRAFMCFIVEPKSAIERDFAI